MKTKFAYLISSLNKRLSLQGNTCPSCGHTSAKVLDRKYLVTDLRRCDQCQLLFRTPTTAERENFLLYQEKYTQGYTTDCPNDARLEELVSVNFAHSERDYSRFINILSALGAKPEQRLLDYGCSWGYGAWQFQKADYKVTAFEISKPRCQYAYEKLGVDAKNTLTEIQGSFDIIFSSHVIEHLPSVSKYLDFAMEHLNYGGFLVTVCPNGSESFRSTEPGSYSKLWGLYHPQLPDEKFYIQKFGKSRLFISSQLSDLSLLENWDKQSFTLGDLSGSELLSIWVKPSEHV